MADTPSSTVQDPLSNELLSCLPLAAYCSVLFPPLAMVGSTYVTTSECRALPLTMTIQDSKCDVDLDPGERYAEIRLTYSPSPFSRCLLGGV